MTIEKLFEGTELSEDAKEQITTIFEAKVSEKVEEKTQELQEELEAIRESQEEQVQEYLEYAKNEMAKNVDSFLNYIVTEWAKDNQKELEAETKVEIAESFTAGIKRVLAENNIEVSEEESSVNKKLQEEVSALKSKLDESLNKQVKTHEELVELKKELIISDVCEELTDTQVEKIFKLSEDIEFKDDESYEKKIQTLKESYFPAEKTKVEEETTSINENEEDKPAKKKLSPLAERVLGSMGSGK